MMKSINNATKLNEGLLSYKENTKLVKSTTYSDSIMLYTKDKSYKSFNSLITAVSGLTNDLFIEGIPHKGAIAFGKMTLDTERSIFFGQPLIDSYLLQEELHFYGIVIHGSVEEKLQLKLNQTGFISKYNCPLKNGKSTHYTVFPMHANSINSEDNGYVEYYKKIRSSLDKMKYKTSGHLRRYIDNSNDYLESIAENAK